jgi:hypothetical protein
LNHAWELQKRENGQKVYSCSRCGAGPVRIPELSGKVNITQTGKKQGIDANCTFEIVKKIHDL